MAHAVSIPGLVTVKANRISPPPAWALLERELISLMEEAAEASFERYTEQGGAQYFLDDVDDLYENLYNWSLFYAIGAKESLLEMALTAWNATTRIADDSIVHRVKNDHYWHGSTSYRKFVPQIHNEYYTSATPHGAEWHHQGEGNMAFYDFGVADPTISENVRRARRFAAMYLGEDPEAPNWDPVHKVLRSPIPTSRGPFHHAKVRHVKNWLQGGQIGREGKPHIGWVPKPMGVRATIYPIVKDLEPGWFESPGRRNQIVEVFNKVVLHSDSGHNLAASGLVTNAYLYSRDEKYKKWVLEYVEVWMERMRRNNGIMPDNVGPTGKIGEHRGGQWWGGLNGWNSHNGFSQLYHSITIAAECALLLSGDSGYLDMLRDSIKSILDNSFVRDDGQLLVPTRYGPTGWEDLDSMRMEELVHLYHASWSSQDRELILRVKAGDPHTDWREAVGGTGKGYGDTGKARFLYYEGQNPDWPDKLLEREYLGAMKAYRTILDDCRDVQAMIDENLQPPPAVQTTGLTQLMLGAPPSVYNGGLLRATVRYYDKDLVRPGLPRDVGALVDMLAPDGVGIHLVNLSSTEARNLIVQAGAFGEHHFTEARYAEKVVPVDSKYFEVLLPPSTSVRIEAGLARFVNDPSYAFPWHGDEIPVPFQ